MISGQPYILDIPRPLVDSP